MTSCTFAMFTSQCFVLCFLSSRFSTRCHERSQNVHYAFHCPIKSKIVQKLPVSLWKQTKSYSFYKNLPFWGIWMNWTFYKQTLVLPLQIQFGASNCVENVNLPQNYNSFLVSSAKCICDSSILSSI